MKSLIIPAITPAGIPAEKDLATALHTGKVMRYGAEGESWEEPMIAGAPPTFHDSCKRILSTFSGRASAVVVAGTTGEGTVLGPSQYQILLSAMKRVCPPDISLYAGILGKDEDVQNQVGFAQSIGVQNILLGINHTHNGIQRLQSSLASLSPSGKIFLYNLPTFKPAERDLILQYLADPRIAGIKDSSGDIAFFSWLLTLKQERPDFRVFHGNEGLYGNLSPEEFKRVDGLVAGNANVHPALLQAYTNNPKHNVHYYGRQELHADIVRGSGRSKGSAVRDIEAHIHGIKRRLTQLCVSPNTPKVTILSPGHDALYSHKPGSLFQRVY